MRMIDIRTLREDLDRVKKSVADRGGTFDFETLEELDRRRRELLASVEKDKATRNRVSGDIAELKKSGGDAESMISEMRQLSDHIKECDVEVSAVEDRLREMMMQLPNIPAESVPYGKDEQDNVEVRRCGEKPYFDFDPKPHWDIATGLGILDWERAAQRDDPSTDAGRIFGTLRALIDLRRRTPALANGDTRFFDTHNGHVLGYVRGGQVLVLANFSEEEQPVRLGWTPPEPTDLIDRKSVV